MAHYASKCVHCTDVQKKCVKTRLEDENGNVFYEEMYECENLSCKVNRGILHIQREIQTADKKTKKGVNKHEENHYHRKGTRKRRTNNWKDGGEPSGDTLL